jgi:hypothetical protein
MVASFMTSLDVRVLDDCGPRPKLMLLEPLHYQSEVVGTVIVPRFFTFDGASIPRAAMSITGWPAVRAACVHDFLLASGARRQAADQAFGEALAVCQVDEGTAQVMLAAVQLYTAMIEHRPSDDRVGA